MGTTELQATEGNQRAAAFGHIVCGIDASRADAETVRQAALLSGTGGKLDVFCVVDATGYGATEQATIAAPRAEKAIEQARHNAAEVGVEAHTCIIHGRSAWDSLAHAAEGADLLVVGSPSGSRAGGIMLGSVATEACHRAELPVLVARQTPGVEFPARILLASDGGPDSRHAAEMAASIAQAHGSEITLLTAGQTAAEQREELAGHAAAITFLTGREPVVVAAKLPAREAIESHARDERPSLVVVGSTGKLGLKALGSVSEHVAHNVPSSVLIARAPKEAR